MKAHGALFFLIFFPVAAWGQSLPGSGTGGTLHTVEMMKWIVYGRTTDVKGEPLGGVIVRVDVGVGIGSVRALKTNLQGEFQTEFSLDATQHKKLTVNLAASKAGY
ncbi:MAG: hypothetical protein LAN62_11725, partial [Acidobacteriia bacterium]|nr:hypothetical protein [Terriglobia bacterium]